MGYKEYKNDNKTNKTPVMLGYQAKGAAPFIKGCRIKNPETIATAIRIGNPQSWDQAIKAVEESKGWFDSYADIDILKAQKMLTEKEGIFCEPASAVSIAGAMQDIKSGKITQGSSVVCTLTGHGLKDPNIAIGQCNQSSIVNIDSKIDEIKQVILKSM